MQAVEKRPSAEAVEMGRQGRFKAGPEHIGTILDSFFKQQGIEESIRVHRAVLDWDSLVGDSVSRHAKAVHIEHGTLIVEVESPGWMHRLQMQELEFRTRVNRHFGEDIIRQIRFRLGSTSRATTEPGSGQENQEDE
jgi:predicted nucleic acid-binding Zn ribbon protein